MSVPAAPKKWRASKWHRWLKVKCQFFIGRSAKLSISGSGDIEIGDGTVASGDYSITGSGNIDAEKLAAQTINASIAGSGDIDAQATGGFEQRGVVVAGLLQRPFDRGVLAPLLHQGKYAVLAHDGVHQHHGGYRREHEAHDAPAAAARSGRGRRNGGG